MTTEDHVFWIQRLTPITQDQAPTLCHAKDKPTLQSTIQLRLESSYLSTELDDYFQLGLKTDSTIKLHCAELVNLLTEGTVSPKHNELKKTTFLLGTICSNQTVNI